MKIFVKICGLATAADVDAAVAAGADAVGFVFAESVRRVTPREALAAVHDLPLNVLRVAVMRHPTADEWEEVLDGFEPDVLQTDARDFAALDVPEHVMRWPVYREGDTLAAPGDGVFVYEGADSGTGTPVDWSRAAQVAARGRMILAGGLGEDNVAAAIRAVRPYGVDVSSGVEALRGQKDHERIRRFVGAVRAVENEL